MTYIRDTLSALLPIADKRSINIFIVRNAEYGVFFFDYFVLGGGTTSGGVPKIYGIKKMTLSSQLLLT